MDAGPHASFSENIQQLFSSGTVILFSCAANSDFPLLSVSSNAEAILGFQKSYFLERKHGWSNRIYPDDKEEVFRGFREVINNGKATINEYRFKTKGGSYIWLRDEIKLIEDEKNGEPIIYGSSIDITNRKKAELALEESKKQYQSVVEHIKDITFSLDGEGRIRFLNDAWKERTGYPLEDSKGQSFVDFIHPEDRPHFEEMYQRLIDRQNEAETKILRCAKKDQEYYWAELYAKRLYDEPGDRVITGTLIDVSEDIGRQQEIEAINERLEKRVNQRSKELKEEIEKRKDIEKLLQQRLEYEKVISKCSNLLLESTSPEALRESLTLLQQVTNSDRVYLYKNRKEDGQLYMDPVMETTAKGVESVIKNSGQKYKYSDLPWWHDKLSQQQTIHDQIDNIPEPEHSILEEQQVKSVLVIPITMNKEWVGYIGFADTKKKRTWAENEISLLQTAADIIAAYDKRKNIEQSLLRQRNYTETILESLPSIYLLMDEDLQFLQWNKNAERYTEYDGHELEDKDAYDLIASSDHEKLREATQQVFEGQSRGAELHLLTKSGDEIPYYWRGYYINLDQENYFLCVGVDITQQKETEKELMDEKRLSEAIIESLPGIFYMIDAEGNYQRWNQNFVDQLGYSSAEIEDMSPADFYADEEYGQIEESIQEVFETGEAEIETNIKTKDGRNVPYYLTGKLFKRDGEHYLVGVGHDISEQIEARERLKKSEELFRNLFLKAPAGIAMVDPDNKVMHVNKSFEELFGYEEDELKGKDLDEMIVPESEPRMPTLVEPSMDNFHREAKRLAKGGTPIDVLVAAIPVYVDGKPLAGFGMYIDITEQKKYEEEIYTSLKEKHVLLQEIHHRVKNNLAVVSGLLQLQIYETDDPVIRETLEESESRIQTMALIHEKLYDSQNLSRISCDSYIGDLVETIKNTIGSNKNVNIATDIAEVELTINKAVPFALLVNEVVTNSFKHAFEEGDEGTIQIDLQVSGDEIHAHIKDNGKGLPEDFSPEKIDSLGMTLINNFAKQLDADWELGSDNGTYINLAFDAGDTSGSSSGLIDL